MKRNFLLVIITILFFAFTTTAVNAACTTKELNTLKQLAHNIKVIYELHDDTYNEQHRYYFDIYVSNFNDKFYFVDSDGREFRYVESLNENGTRYLREVSEGLPYKLEVYTSNETNCPNTKITTKKTELPYYNDYSQREECNGIEEFYLCQKYYSGYIESDEFFLKQIEKYKKNDIVEAPDEVSWWSNITLFLSSNLLIVIPASVILILLIIVLIVKGVKSKNRKKVKI